MALGSLILTGADKRFEVWFLDHDAPVWLSTLAIAR